MHINDLIQTQPKSSAEKEMDNSTVTHTFQ